MKEPAKRILGMVLLAAALWPLFYKLGEAPLRAWDESLFAMRAYYAVEEGGYLPNFDYYPGITFYRNLKPPFGTWWQALSYRMFGYDEWALRLPVAVFSALLVAMLWFWRRAVPDLPYSGVAAGLILVLSPGFLRDHVARTGDHDAILLLVMTAGLLLVYLTERTYAAGQVQRRRLYLGLLGLTLLIGFLTKSFFAFSLLPAFALWLIWRKRLVSLLREPMLWAAAAFVMGGVVLYYALMERAFPGFMSFESDTVLGRYVKVQDGHQLSWNYYIAEFFSRRFWPWWGVLLLHGGLMFWIQNSGFRIPDSGLHRRPPTADRPTPTDSGFRISDSGFRAMARPLPTADRRPPTDSGFRAFGGLLWLSLLVHFVVVTFSVTKLSWYDAPLYPIAALMAGSAVQALIEQFPDWKKMIWIVLAVLLAGFSVRAVRDISQTGPASDDERYQPFMEYLQQKRPEIKAYKVYCHEYNGQTGFTARLLNDQYGYNISVAVYYPEERFAGGDYILVCSAEKEERIQKEHIVEIAEESGGCKLLLLKGDR
jgi:4-amino-4-deoxy-L-arabinose transferase-like glycosyltransferase